MPAHARTVQLRYETFHFRGPCLLLAADAYCTLSSRNNMGVQHATLQEYSMHGENITNVQMQGKYFMRVEMHDKIKKITDLQTLSSKRVTFLLFYASSVRARHTDTRAVHLCEHRA